MHGDGRPDDSDVQPMNQTGSQTPLHTTRPPACPHRILSLPRLIDQVFLPVHSLIHDNSEILDRN